MGRGTSRREGDGRIGLAAAHVDPGETHRRSTPVVVAGKPDISHYMVSASARIG
jgi:hypothetical protein